MQGWWGRNMGVRTCTPVGCRWGRTIFGTRSWSPWTSSWTDSPRFCWTCCLCWSRSSDSRSYADSAWPSPAGGNPPAVYPNPRWCSWRTRRSRCTGRSPDGSRSRTPDSSPAAAEKNKTKNAEISKKRAQDNKTMLLFSGSTVFERLWYTTETTLHF